MPKRSTERTSQLHRDRSGSKNMSKSDDWGAGGSMRGDLGGCGCVDGGTGVGGGAIGIVCGCLD